MKKYYYFEKDWSHVDCGTLSELIDKYIDCGSIKKDYRSDSHLDTTVKNQSELIKKLILILANHQDSILRDIEFNLFDVSIQEIPDDSE